MTFLSRDSHKILKIIRKSSPDIQNIAYHSETIMEKSKLSSERFIASLNALSDAGLIEFDKGQKDIIRLTDKGIHFHAMNTIEWIYVIVTSIFFPVIAALVTTWITLLLF